MAIQNTEERISFSATVQLPILRLDIWELGVFRFKLYFTITLVECTVNGASDIVIIALISSPHSMTELNMVNKVFFLLRDCCVKSAAELGRLRQKMNSLRRLVLDIRCMFSGFDHIFCSKVLVPLHAYNVN